MRLEAGQEVNDPLGFHVGETFLEEHRGKGLHLPLIGMGLEGLAIGCQHVNRHFNSELLLRQIKIDIKFTFSDEA